MNYITQLNAFEQWLETNRLPAQSQLLWYKLVALDNRCGWAEWITVDNLRLMILINCTSKNTFLRARDKLVDAGLVVYIKGKKGQPNRYKIIELQKGSKNEPQTGLQMEPQTGLQMEPQTGHINKLNETYLFLFNKYAPLCPSNKNFEQQIKYIRTVKQDLLYSELDKLEQMDLISELMGG